ncbi:MAG: hypothetical protein F6K19_26815 [Cyanothece sp. SIO1E1]|nr:hypothetical protein [Cyanothece sp. SIO1E1]
MKTSTLRQLWVVIHEMPTGLLLLLSDIELIQRLLHTLSHSHTLTFEEKNAVRAYLYNKLPLIRDLAESRLVA